ncbi:MAG TPA: DUF2007 domain-containing protein [Pirellulales bacterium]|nr:DUF2007 domain-containing protein [Pirellulales bacterium]
MSESSVVIYTAATPQEAFLLRDALAEAGIRALVSNEALQAAAGDVPLGWTIAPRLLVAPEDAADARRLAEAYEQRRKTSSTLLETELEPEKPPAPARCPECHRPRTAICPVCGTGGSRFRPGEMAGEAETTDGPVLLICPMCDEPFEPGYLRRCEWCGNEFADGVAPPAAPAPPTVEPPNTRVIAVGVLIAATIAGVIAYFAFVVKG